MLVLLPLICACSFSTQSLFAPAPPPTLSDLQPITLPVTQDNLPAVSLAELTEIYQQVLTVTDDPAIRLQVLHRLADLQMLQGEEQLAQAEAQDMERLLFTQAIDSYQALLRSNPHDARNDRLLYQLSKAHDLKGELDQSLFILEQLSQQYPQSPHYVEASFRMAESYFNNGKYAAAERAYQQVIARGDATVYYRNALYMHGWALFKQARYQRAINSFSLTLDLLLPADNNLDGLPRGERELSLDSLRVLAVTFSYLDGPDTITSAYAELGYRPYQHLLYQQLGELYLRQQRYRDSAEAYRAFTTAWPDSDRAHQFQIRVIETYESGGFLDLIVAEKRRYVEAYGLYSDYWINKQAAVREAIEPTLKLFIEELATHYHALAQTETESETEAALASEHYQLAADYYQLFIDSFTDDPRVAELAFLLAESRWEAGDIAAATSTYQWVAYQFPHYERAADAGYAAILGYDKLPYSRDKIDSQLQFSIVFASDSRAPLVLNNAANALLELEEYQQAIIVAATLVRWQPVPGDEIIIPAWLIIAHSHFELQQYPDAEQAYLQALTQMPALDERREQVLERTAASIYRQAEAAVAAADYPGAAQQFARVIELAPSSSIRVQAQYDAAVNYMAAAQFAQANLLLLDFRQRFTDHELSAGVAVKLAHNYQQLQQWELAASELEQMRATETDPERQRQLHYLTAEYYDKAGNHEQARLRYRSYAHAWMEPPAVRFEAMHRLSELYDEAGVPDKRRFWLRKIIASHGTAGEAQSERSLYLAAFASSVLAEDRFRAYERLEIRHPMARSLKKKKIAMKKALAAYQQTYDYGVSQFSTQATYKMAEVFSGLSQDLLHSERPAKLDALALEQYEILLEEQAYPFEEKAIAIHQSNARRSWEGLYDEWVQQSFVALALLLPARYAKTESGITYSQDIY